MICQVLYYLDDSKCLKSTGFSDPDKAKKWIDEKSTSTSITSRIQNARIVVGYEAVETYKEMYDLLRNEVFGKSKKDKNII